MSGIKYLKNTSSLVDLSNEHFTNVENQRSNTLYVRISSSPDVKIKYGLTTDTTASIYSPKIRIGNQVAYIASQDTVRSTETTGTSYHTSTSYEDDGTVPLTRASTYTYDTYYYTATRSSTSGTSNLTRSSTYTYDTYYYTSTRASTSGYGYKTYYKYNTTNNTVTISVHYSNNSTDSHSDSAPGYMMETFSTSIIHGVENFFMYVGGTYMSSHINTARSVYISYMNYTNTSYTGSHDTAILGKIYTQGITGSQQGTTRGEFWWDKAPSISIKNIGTKSSYNMTNQNVYYTYVTSSTLYSSYTHISHTFRNAANTTFTALRVTYDTYTEEADGQITVYEPYSIAYNSTRGGYYSHLRQIVSTYTYAKSSRYFATTHGTVSSTKSATATGTFNLYSGRRETSPYISFKVTRSQTSRTVHFTGIKITSTANFSARILTDGSYANYSSFVSYGQMVSTNTFTGINISSYTGTASYKSVTRTYVYSSTSSRSTYTTTNNLAASYTSNDFFNREYNYQDLSSITIPVITRVNYLTQKSTITYYTGLSQFYVYRSGVYSQDMTATYTRSSTYTYNTYYYTSTRSSTSNTSALTRSSTYTYDTSYSTSTRSSTSGTSELTRSMTITTRTEYLTRESSTVTNNCNI